MTVEPDFLQDCQTHQNQRAETGFDDTPVREKIHGPVDNLQRMATYVSITGVPGGLAATPTRTREQKVSLMTQW